MDSGNQWNETQPMHLIGFNLNFNDEPSLIDVLTLKSTLFLSLDFRRILYCQKDYPEAISEAYGIHFRSRLDYLRNREEFVEIFDYNYFKIDFYEDALAYIDEHGVKTYGVLVFGTAEEFLENIDNIPYNSLHINEVLPTKPNIYYN